jgi:hypothetical protein
MGICCTDHATPSIRRSLSLASPTSGIRPVSIDCLQTKAAEFSLTFKRWTFEAVVAGAGWSLFKCPLLLHV